MRALRCTSIIFLTHKNPDKQIIRIRVVFFILDLSEKSLQLCKSLWELVNAKFSKQIVTNEIKFTM